MKVKLIKKKKTYINLNGPKYKFKNNPTQLPTIPKLKSFPNRQIQQKKLFVCIHISHYLL